MLQGCALVDLFHDSVSENDPLPENSPYKQNAAENGLSPQFTASVTDKMVTDFSMQIVTGNFTGNSVNGVLTDKNTRKDLAKKALLYGNETLLKLTRTGLLFRSKHSSSFLVSSIKGKNWTLSCVKDRKILFSASVTLPEKDSPSR